jgi:DNA-binding GntR family transcriptional regulator
MPRADKVPLREKITRRLKNGPLTVDALVELTGHSRSSVRSTLHNLKQEGVVENFSLRGENIRGYQWRLRSVDNA